MSNTVKYPQTSLEKSIPFCVTNSTMEKASAINRLYFRTAINSTNTPRVRKSLFQSSRKLYMVQNSRKQTNPIKWSSGSITLLNF